MKVFPFIASGEFLHLTTVFGFLLSSSRKNTFLGEMMITVKCNNYFICSRVSDVKMGKGLGDDLEGFFFIGDTHFMTQEQFSYSRSLKL